MKPPAPLPRTGSRKGRAAAFCNLPLLLLIGAIQFLVIYSPAIDRYMVMVTKGKPGFPSLLLDGRRGFKLVEEESIPEPRVRCDFADPRSDVCELEGAIRIRGSTSEVFVVAPAGAGADGLLAANVTGLAPGMNATSWTIQPYTRKGEARVMRSITTLTVRVVSAADAPPCTVRHDVPAVVYSNGGYCGNYYHDFNDNIIPLFVTARHLGGEVQLLVAQKQAWWFHKYREIVDGLTNYEAVDLGGGDGAGDGGEVRCFRRATLGLRSHKDLSIDPRRAPRNLSMVDFKRFLMWRYALPREHAIRTDEEEAAGAGAGRRRPRLLVVTRRSRRRFVNLPEIVALAEEVGFDVTASDLMSASSSAAHKAAVAGDEGHSRMADASKLVNSFDAMVAVHGSGLTNLVFLPMNAVVVQVVPLGRMEGLAMDEYGVPPRDMNMRYLQYNITAEESTLSEVYPRAHPVLLDPMPIHEQSWSLVKDVYLGKQDVRLDVRRFRPVLVKALQLLR